MSFLVNANSGHRYNNDVTVASETLWNLFSSTEICIFLQVLIHWYVSITGWSLLGASTEMLLEAQIYRYEWVSPYRNLGKVLFHLQNLFWWYVLQMLFQWDFKTAWYPPCSCMAKSKSKKKKQKKIEGKKLFPHIKNQKPFQMNCFHI